MVFPARCLAPRDLDHPIVIQREHFSGTALADALQAAEIDRHLQNIARRTYCLMTWRLLVARPGCLVSVPSGQRIAMSTVAALPTPAVIVLSPCER